ncbi:GGDEF domain-containing protein [Oryzibacter oryziterrae]|uniref:GGDEF domain-containing protein n=1 Tax=Oryzibacter oryziterrae TaxID=2766474 RepID=UPI001F259849|nr:GGDEF domain-containing protein [Oryzibacter oryziterrae]
MALGWTASRNSSHFVYWGASYAAFLVTMILLMGRALLPDAMSIGFANGLGLLGYGLAWLGLKKFAGRITSSDIAFSLSGIVIWFLFATLTKQYESINARTILISALNVAFSFAVIREVRLLRQQEPLSSYTSLIGMFSIHSVSHIARIGLVLTAPLPEGSDALPRYGWYVWIGLEAAISMAFMGPNLLAMHSQRTERKLRTAAETDSLTGLCNRRIFMKSAKQMVEASTGSGALILFDLDHFKSINDTHGHSVGDMALVAFADALSARIQEPDIFARVGGEEFALYMPHASAGIATSFASHLRQCVRDINIPTNDQPIKLSVSCGIAAISETGPNFELLLTAADTALYDAKRTGRDRAVVFSKAMRLKMFLGASGTSNLDSMVI